MNVHVTLHMSQQGLQIETIGKGLLDSGCSRTVAGQLWYNEFLNTLSEAERMQVTEMESKSVFRFGDGIETASLKKVSIPVCVGKHKFQMNTEIVANEIPMLISKDAMKEMGMKLDFTHFSIHTTVSSKLLEMPFC